MAKKASYNARDIISLLGEPRAVMLVGLPASGKSTLALDIEALGYERFSADAIRGELLGDEGLQADHEKVFGVLHSRLDEALARGARVVIDNMNLTRRSRRPLRKILSKYGISPKLVLLDVTLGGCKKRNKERKRQVGEDILESRARAIRAHGSPDRDEEPFLILQPGKIGRYFVEPKSAVMKDASPAFNTNFPLSPSGCFDAIGDVHGCYDELLELIAALGYKLEFEESTSGSVAAAAGSHAVTVDWDPPSYGLPVVRSFTAPTPGRKLAFVGDLIDRGPASELVLNLVRQLVERGDAIAVRGNHDDKLKRYLEGRVTKLGNELSVTLEKLERHGESFLADIFEFLESLPFVYETPEFVFVHAAFREDVSSNRGVALALYGETDGTLDATGHPVRLDKWESEYEGSKTIVHGHVPVPEVTVRELAATRPGQLPRRIVNVDTGCCFGGSLTAVRLPEREFVSVPSRAVYVASWTVSDDDD